MINRIVSPTYGELSTRLAPFSSALMYSNAQRQTRKEKKERERDKQTMNLESRRENPSRFRFSESS